MAEFYFELLSNGEKTNFQEIEGVSTEVALRNNLKDGDNPFKFRLPNLPKGNKLVLKKGQTNVGSTLLQWADQAKNQENKIKKDKASLTLKDAKGRSLVEWTLFNAFPGPSNMAATYKKTTVTEIENLQLNFSFFTFSKK
jgi:phage tail-like protein